MKNEIICSLCGKKLKALGFHLPVTHNITPKEYRKCFPNSELMSEAQREVMSKKAKKQFEDPKARERMSVSAKKQWQDPAFKEMTINRLRGFWDDEEYSIMVKENLKSLWNEDWYRKLQSDKLKNLWKNEEYRKKMSDATIERQTDWEFLEEYGTFRRYFPYSVMFTHEFRESKRKEYNNTCPITGMTNEEHKELYGRAFTVHHGNDNKDETDPYWFIPMNIQIHSFITSALNHEERLAFIGGYLDDHEENMKKDKK